MTDEHEHAMKVAKVIAKAMGDNFSDAFKNKQRWTAKRGMSGGRFRDVNEPFQDDYIAAAQAAAAVIAADRAGLVAEIERLRANAARYEWLRDCSCPPHNFYISVPDEFACTRYTPDEVDTYIDAARAALKDTRND